MRTTTRLDPADYRVWLIDQAVAATVMVVRWQAISDWRFLTPADTPLFWREPSRKSRGCA